MREQTGGRGLVSEIAHFIAHPKIRTQGLVTNELRDLFWIVKFRASLDTRKVITTDVPATVSNALRGNLRRMRASVLKRETGLTPAQAKAMLEKIIATMTPTGGGLSKPLIFTETEFSLFICAGSQIKGGPLFSEDDLLKDFARALKDQNLLADSEIGALKKAKTGISLFALLAMHGIKVDLADGTAATIYVARDVYDNLGSFGYTELLAEASRRGRTTGVGWVFKTSLSISRYCEPNVPVDGRHPFLGDFEMTTDMKLGRES